MALTDPQVPAVLVLEDGTFYHGTSYGAEGKTLGEAVFSTGMTGYQETLTDPSYAGQIVVQTAPHIGNTGVNSQDAESAKIWVSGYVIRDASPRPSNWRSQGSLEEELLAAGIVGISGIDTRALTRRLRKHGSMRAGIFSGQMGKRSEQDLLAEVKNSAHMTGRQLANQVSTGQGYSLEPADHGWKEPLRATLVTIDLGIKAMTPIQFAQRGVRVHVLNLESSLDEILALQPDGVFFSNGPGDPITADQQVDLLQNILRRRIPFFGICFGQQLLGRALGFETYKLKFGHRGINQPVLDRSTGRVQITAHNHGFAVKAPLDGPVTAPRAEFGRVEVSHLCLNDRVVEGLACLDLPAFSVQYHPEAAAGPHDATYLFDRFISLMMEHHTQASKGL